MRNLRRITLKMLDDPDLPREQEMRRVYQSGKEGCGIACVAMLAGTTYAAAKQRVPHWEDRGTYTDELRKELEYYEIQTEPRKPIRGLNYQSFRFNAVLRGKLGGEWHWAVWDADRRKLLDPYTPGGRFRCTSFIKVVSRAHQCRKPSGTHRFISIRGALP